MGEPIVKPPAPKTKTERRLCVEDGHDNFGLILYRCCASKEVKVKRIYSKMLNLKLLCQHSLCTSWKYWWLINGHISLAASAPPLNDQTFSHCCSCHTNLIRILLQLKLDLFRLNGQSFHSVPGGISMIFSVLTTVFSCAYQNYLKFYIYVCFHELIIILYY